MIRQRAHRRHGNEGATPPVALQRLTIGPTATATDGPSWYYANNALNAIWEGAYLLGGDWPGGDWLDADGVMRGENHYGVATYNGTVYVWPDIGPLIQKLLDDGNTGIMLKVTTRPLDVGSNAEPQLVSQHHPQGPGDLEVGLTVVTTTGTFNPPLLQDCNVNYNSVVACAVDWVISCRGAMLKYDLTGVTGTVTSATLTPYHFHNGYGQPIAIDYLAPSRIYDHLRVQRPNSIEYGLAQDFPADVGLKDHPSVVWHPRMDNTTNFFADWLGQYNHDPAGEPQNLPWIDQSSQTGGPGAYDRWGFPWEDGIKNFRMITQSPGYIIDGTGSTILSWRHFIGGAYTELYYRYLFEWEPDTQAGNAIGGKMPGFVSDSLGYDMRMSFGNQSAINPGYTTFLSYIYDGEISAGVLTFDLFPLMKHGRRHCVETYLKLNTYSNGAWNQDGVFKVWFDGYKVYQNLARRIVHQGGPAVHDRVSANFYHGGEACPNSPFKIKYGGVYVSTAYIGPPTTMP